MRLPAPLLRRNHNVHKNQFGHVFIVAGSERMLGAGALCGLAAMRTGVGLVTIGVAKSMNLTLQKKISSTIMTLPLLESLSHGISYKSYAQIKMKYASIQAMAIGPGLGQEAGVKKLVLKVIQDCPVPLVVDADALNILSSHLSILLKAKAPRILTPHVGEMQRLTGFSSEVIETNREQTAKDFARKYRCVLLLKGHRTVVASTTGKCVINRTGNAGMAKAGSGDVLTGMIAALLGQGIDPFEAAQAGAFLHGAAGDEAVKHIAPASLIATDIIEYISGAIKKLVRNQ